MCQFHIEDEKKNRFLYARTCIDFSLGMSLLAWIVDFGFCWILYLPDNLIFFVSDVYKNPLFENFSFVAVFFFSFFLFGWLVCWFVWCCCRIMRIYFILNGRSIPKFKCCHINGHTENSNNNNGAIYMHAFSDIFFFFKAKIKIFIVS